MEELLKIIFLWLGIAFILIGVLSFIGILKPSANSQVQDPVTFGIVFSLLGIVFTIMQTFLQIVVTNKNKLHSELLSSGTKVNGIVENVYLQRNAQYGKKSPYRILYTYIYRGEKYHHKSCFLWDKPDFSEGDSIVVYTNDAGKSTIML